MPITNNGKEYARVTEVLSQYNDFSHIDPNVLERKRDIGSDVHDAIEDHLKDDMPLLTPLSWGYYKSFQIWKDRTDAKFIESERRYFDDELMLTGKIDALVRFHEERSLVLVDFKTSAQESPTWVMQAHCYHLLVSKCSMPIQPRFLFLKLDKYGKTPIVFEYKFDANIQRKCISDIKMYWETRKNDSH